MSCLPLLVFLAIVACPLAAFAADISVVATVDQNQVSLGESVTYTITVRGTQSGANPSIPSIDGLAFGGPSVGTQVQIVNGQMSQSLSYSYRVTPSRMGEFTIPAIAVQVGGNKFMTEPIKITVVKNAMEEALKEMLYARLQFEPKQMVPGEAAEVRAVLYVRDGLGLVLRGPPPPAADGLTLRCQQLDDSPKSEQVINGVKFIRLTYRCGALATRTGPATLGPFVFQTQLRVPKRGGRRSAIPFFDNDPFFANYDVRDIPVPTEAAHLEITPLPDKDRPPDFTGAIGQWNLDVRSDRTEASVGEPITLTATIAGKGNIEGVQLPKIHESENFKVYEPAFNTPKNDLGLEGERVFEQVLVPQSDAVKELPEVRFSYFDPVTGEYKTLKKGPFPLLVKPAPRGTTVVAAPSSEHQKRTERLGEDIVYLKTDLGPAAATVPLCAKPLFLVVNAAPILVLVGAVAWKRRTDKLRADVAYARRSRAAKNARKLLAEAGSYDEVQRSLQSYLGDRLNIPPSGITASIADEHLVPRGLNGEMAGQVKACFEECDTARFAGGSTATDVATIRQKVERLIDELEKRQL